MGKTRAGGPITVTLCQIQLRALVTFFWIFLPNYQTPTSIKSLFEY